MRGCRGRGVGRLVVAWFLLAASASLAAPRDDFKRGVEAVDLGRFEDAVEHLRRAVRGDGRESAEPVFLSGVFSRPYLPHYYLGDALFRWDDRAHCEEAVEAWNESDRQGVVQGFRRQWKELREGREKCLETLLPQLRRGAREAVGTVRDRLPVLADPFDDPALETRRKELLKRAASLEGEIDSEDLAVLRTTRREAEELAAAVTALGERAASRRTERLESARALARRSFGDAEAALGSWGEGTALARERAELERARRLLSAADDPEKVAAAGRAAAKVAADLDALRRRSRAEERPPEPRTVEPAAGAPAAGVPAAGVPEPSLPRAAPPSPTENSNGNPRLAPWLAEGRALLDEVGEPSPDRELLSLQVERIRILLEETSRNEADDESRLRRFRESCLALRLVAGIEAHLAGESRRALGLLTSSLLASDPGATETGYGNLWTQVDLFRAAASFSLYRLGGEVDDEMRRRASGDLRRAFRRSPELRLSEKVFSPAFREFAALERDR